MQTRPNAQWYLNHEPATNTQASAVTAANPQKTKVIRTLSFSMGGTGASALVSCRILDGATVIWAATMAHLAGDSKSITLSGLAIKGTKGSSMTIQFSAAGGLNTTQAVSATGESE
jgi:hypothetical protein